MHILAAFAAMGAISGSEFSLEDETIFGNVSSGSSFNPIAGYRLSNNGEALKAEGSTQAPLSYNRLGIEYLEGGFFNTADYEVEFVVDSETGSAGTWTGAPRGAATWTNLASTLTWTWQKDTLADGTATANVTATVRRVATPSTFHVAALIFKAGVLV